MNKQTTHSASFHCPGRANAEICDAFECDGVSVSMSTRVRIEFHAERMSPPILHKFATFAISFGQSAPRVQFGPGVSSKFQCCICGKKGKGARKSVCELCCAITKQRYVQSSGPFELQFC